MKIISFNKKVERIGKLLVAFNILNFLDIITTYIFITNEFAQEGNPLARWGIESIGLFNIFMFKWWVLACFTLLMYIIILKYKEKFYNNQFSFKKFKRFIKISTYSSIGLVGLYVAVVVSNTLFIIRCCL